MTKVKVHGMKVISEFKKKHAPASSYINTWLAEAKGANWNSSQDIEAHYSDVDFQPGNRVIFKLKGNEYRVDILIAYKAKALLVKRLGTHEEYGKWNWEPIL